MQRNNWRGVERTMRGSGKIHTFTDEDIAEYKKAWSQSGAMNAMINWYRAAVRYLPKTLKEGQVKVPMLMLWGMKDAVLSHRMARPSLDYCDDWKLVFFEDATHWVQHDEAEGVNQLLVEFLSR